MFGNLGGSAVGSSLAELSKLGNGGAGQGGFSDALSQTPASSFNLSEGLGDIFGKDGWGIGAFGALSGLAQAFLGKQQLGLAKNSLNFQKSAYDTNLANTAKSNNTYKNDLYQAKLEASQGNPMANLSSLAEYKKATDVSGSRTA